MSTETFDGKRTKIDICPENPISWRFFPMKKGGKVGFADIVQELFDQGMEGNLYAQVFKVPGEYPVDADNNVELMEPEDACKILADWCGFKLYDRSGNQLV